MDSVQKVGEQRPTNFGHLTPGGFVRLKKVEAFTDLGSSTIYELGDKGLFPKPVKIGPRASAWLADELIAWKAARIAERDAALEADRA